MNTIRAVQVCCKRQNTLIQDPDYGWANSARKQQSGKWAEFRRTQQVAKKLAKQKIEKRPNSDQSLLQKIPQIEDMQQKSRVDDSTRIENPTERNEVPTISSEKGLKGRLERIMQQRLSVQSNSSVRRGGAQNYVKKVLDACLSPEEVIAACELLWPTWAQKGHYLLDQSTGEEVPAPRPPEAALSLLRIAKLLRRKYHSFSPSLARSGCVRGLVEALRITKPRLVYDGTNDHLFSEDQSKNDEDDIDDPMLQLNDPQYFSVKPLFGPVEQPDRWVMDSLGWQQTSAAIWAIGSLAGPLFYAEEMEALVLGLNCLNGQANSHQANRMLIGLSKARHYASCLPQLASQSMELFLNKNQDKDRNYNQDFVGNVTALAQLGYWPSQLKDVLSRDIDVRNFSSEQLTLLLWSLAVLELVESQLFKNMWYEVCQRGLKGINPKKWQLCQLYQTALCIQLEANTFQADSLGWNDEAAKLLQVAEQAWNAQGKDLEKKHESYYQRSIANTLSSMGLFHVKEDVSSGYAIDLTLPEYKIAIEAEGPHHMSRTDLRLLGPTRFKHRLLRAMGWRLVSIAYHEWDALFDIQEQRDYLGIKMGEVMDKDEKRTW